MNRDEQDILDFFIAPTLQEELKDFLLPARYTIFTNNSLQDGAMNSNGKCLSMIIEKKPFKPEEGEKVHQD